MFFGDQEKKLLCTIKNMYGLFLKPKSNLLIIHDNSILLDMIQKKIEVIFLIKTGISYSRGNT